MKLSVLVTTYNSECYIAETLDSIFSQITNFEYEVIVGDDGSTDNTVDIVEAYKKIYGSERLKYYIMERKKGEKYNKIQRASKNRLNVLKEANGEFITFLDGDDVYCDELKLQKQVDILEKEENRDCIACAHNCIVSWNKDNEKIMNAYTKDFKLNGKKIWRYGIYFFCGSIMMRNICNSELYDEINCDFFDDNLITFYLLSKGEIYYLADVMVKYRQHDNSLWNSMSEEEKNIEDLIEYDLEKKINTQFKIASEVRHMRHFNYFWKNRYCLTESLIEKYIVVMKKNNFENALKWTNYSKLNIKERTRQIIFLNKCRILFIYTKICKRIEMHKYL